MSYHVYLFRKEVREAESKSTDKHFWDNETNLVPFKAEQKKYLHDRLLRHGFVQDPERADNYQLKNKQTINAILTDRGLYFSGSFTQNDIFEIGMTASEFADTEEFVKYDPQNAEWNDGL